MNANRYAETLSGADFKQFNQDGFLLIDGLVSLSDVGILQRIVDDLIATAKGSSGVRNVLQKSQYLRELATVGIPAKIAAAILGASAKPTKLTIFDKTDSANWKVPWHQDLAIAVAQRHEVTGFGPWSIKDGVPHVQPPVSILESILAIRLHLDDTPATNGALRVLPGTHQLGRLSDENIALLRKTRPEIICPVAEGGAMLMRPLLLHASSLSLTPKRRRVLHFEYSAIELPSGLSWT